MIPRLGWGASGLQQHGRLAGVLLVLAVSIATVTCDSIPLLAPTGSTITLTASSNAIPANGSAQLVAYVQEASGTPPHQGTQVIFTTTLGVIEPAEAVTDVNGRAVATFRGNGANGTATINAASGAASTSAPGTGTGTGGTGGTTTRAVTIAVGTAAVGRITLTANPTTISANGGSSTVTANVVDLNGNALVGAPVSFATSQGVLSGSLVNTDATGNAQTTLTTSIEAVVTATVGVGTGTGTGGGGGGGGGGTTPGTGGGSTSGQGTATVTVRVNPLPTVSITADGTIFTAGMPVTFSISAQPGTNSTAQIRDVVVSFGDGDSQSLGGVSGTGLKVQHRYDDEGTFTVSVRVTDTLGTVVSAATVLVVEAQPPLAVAINHSQTTNVGLTTVNFTATVTPATAVVTSYVWNFGDGSPPRTTSSNQTVHQYNDDNVTKIVTVTVTTTTGRTATGSSSVTP